MTRTAQDVAVDLEVLAALLHAEGVAIDGPLRAARIGHGQSNLTYLVEDGAQGRWVARRPPRGDRLASAHDVVREHRIIAALAGTDVPVPAALACYVDDALADAPVVVMEHVDGLVVDTVADAAALAPAVRSRIGPSLARALAAVHRVDVDAVGLGDLASRAPYGPRQLKRWSRQWALVRTRDAPALDALTDLLWRTVPEHGEIALVHGDLSLRNVILDAASGEVRSVLDWELSTLGDPLADVGTLLAYWPEPADPPTSVFAASTLSGFGSRAELAAAYLAATGRSGADLGFWHVLGLWKLAILGAGIARRALDDPRNAGAGGPPSTEHLDALVAHAWDVAETTGLAR